MQHAPASGRAPGLSSGCDTHLCGVWREAQVRGDGGYHRRHTQQVFGQEGRQAGHDIHAGGVQPKLLLWQKAAGSSIGAGAAAKLSGDQSKGGPMSQRSTPAGDGLALRTRASRSAVATSSASPGSRLPPGKHTSPAGAAGRTEPRRWPAVPADGSAPEHAPGPPPVTHLQCPPAPPRPARALTTVRLQLAASLIEHHVHLARHWVFKQRHQDGSKLTRHLRRGRGCGLSNGGGEAASMHATAGSHWGAGGGRTAGQSQQTAAASAPAAPWAPASTTPAGCSQHAPAGIPRPAAPPWSAAS